MHDFDRRFVSEPLELTVELVRRASVTPRDAGCQEILRQRLNHAGFTSESMPFGEVSNLWARRGRRDPLFVFAGHTDVVPSGPLSAWTSPPFEPDIRDGHLYGRGAADMKGSLAAMTVAAERFIAEHPEHRGSIGFLITSDEEGPAVDGTARVVEKLRARGEHIEWCLVGEPSSTERIGDVIRVGRRGSLSGCITVHGLQGHVAYPHLVDNPIHKFAPALAELAETTWCTGNEDFPPTTFQVSNITSGTGAENVVPGELEARFNFRYSTALGEEELRARTEAILNKHGVGFAIEWRLGGEPFLNQRGELTKAVSDALVELSGVQTRCSTEGGTSDGRFIAPAGAQVVELGPVNQTIHKVDECVRVSALDELALVYQRILEKLCA